MAGKGLGHFCGGWEHLTVRVWLVVLPVGHGGVESKGQVLEQSTSTAFLSSWTLVFLGSGAFNLEPGKLSVFQRWPQLLG